MDVIAKEKTIVKIFRVMILVYEPASVKKNFSNQHFYSLVAILIDIIEIFRGKIDFDKANFS